MTSECIICQKKHDDALFNAIANGKRVCHTCFKVASGKLNPLKALFKKSSITEDEIKQAFEKQSENINTDSDEVSSDVNLNCVVCDRIAGEGATLIENHNKVCKYCFEVARAKIKPSKILLKKEESISKGEVIAAFEKIMEGQAAGYCDSCNRAFASFKLSNSASGRQLCKACKNHPNDSIDNISFNATKEIGQTARFNDNNKELLVNGANLINYKEVIAFELIEDGETITSGGLGRAAVGGLLFGGAGAVVGAVTAGKKGKTFVLSIKVKITVDNTKDPIVYVFLLDKRVKTDSEEYKKAYEEAQELLSTLEVICKRNESSEVVEGNSTAKIREFKALFDEGIITEEEFASKKKELLGT